MLRNNSITKKMNVKHYKLECYWVIVKGIHINNISTTFVSTDIKINETAS